MTAFALIAALLAADTAPPERVVRVSARKFSFSPDLIDAKVGEPLVVELTSEDRMHGFKIPDLDVRIDVEPGKPVRVRIVPVKAGTFAFHCDVFCGSGHEEMSGTLVVKP
jgi:cytochrome c oxidase subunit 2